MVSSSGDSVSTIFTGEKFVIMIGSRPRFQLYIVRKVS